MEVQPSNAQGYQCEVKTLKGKMRFLLEEFHFSISMLYRLMDPSLAGGIMQPKVKENLLREVQFLEAIQKALVVLCQEIEE